MKTLALLLFLLPLSAWAQGGPPMVTDDPATPGDRHWEINIASIYSSTSQINVLQAPYFDINYGWGDQIQLKFETGWVNTWHHPAPDGSGASSSLLGVKYRFLDEDKDGISVSMYPQIQFRHFFSSHDPEIAEPGNQYTLPFEFAKTFGSWVINPEIGYIYGTTVKSEMLFGVVLAYENAKPFEPLFEVHVNSHFDGSGSTTLLNLGLRYAFSPMFNGLFAIGHTVTVPTGELPELDAYVGLQIEI